MKIVLSPLMNAPCATSVGSRRDPGAAFRAGIGFGVAPDAIARESGCTS
jgi:hypothetical protein